MKKLAVFSFTFFALALLTSCPIGAADGEGQEAGSGIVTSIVIGPADDLGSTVPAVISEEGAGEASQHGEGQSNGDADDEGPQQPTEPTGTRTRTARCCEAISRLIPFRNRRRDEEPTGEEAAAPAPTDEPAVEEAAQTGEPTTEVEPAPAQTDEAAAAAASIGCMAALRTKATSTVASLKCWGRRPAEEPPPVAGTAPTEESDGSEEPGALSQSGTERALTEEEKRAQLIPDAQVFGAGSADATDATDRV